jgi:PAS domain S-box-containing protein
MMPKLDGFGLIRALRDDAELRTVPVLVLSARAGEEAKLEGLQHGADDYLVKPFSARELIGRVEALRQADAIRRNALEALRQSNAQSKALLDHAPLGAYLVDADFVMREVNPLALPVFGDIPGGAIGRDFAEIIHILWPASFADEIVRQFRHTLATGEPYVATETSARRLDRGITEYYDWRIDRIPLPDGRHGVVCYFRDIAEQVRARRTLEDSQAALREADRRKDEFLATLSHELRNPLAPIRNALHLLEGDHGEAITRRALEIMGRQLNQLTRLVDDLMEVSRITRGKLELRRERVLVADVVCAAVETSEPLIRAGAHRLLVDMPKDPIWIDGDAMRLAQVLANLLNNAAKYTSQKGVIELSARSDGVQTEIRVRDNGMGIRADVLPRVFNMFERGRGDAMSSKDGLGVGLALAKHLVALHHGTIEARSEGEDRGAEFLVRLPVAAELPRPLPATVADSG